MTDTIPDRSDMTFVLTEEQVAKIVRKWTDYLNIPNRRALAKLFDCHVHVTGERVTECGEHMSRIYTRLTYRFGFASDEEAVLFRLKFL